MMAKGWIRTEVGVVEPVWSWGPGLPKSLVDLRDTGGREEEEKEEQENEDEFDFDDFSGSDCEWWSNNYNFEAHDRLRRGSSKKKIIMDCSLPRSVNELVNELSGFSVFTISWIDLQINRWLQKQHNIL